MFELIYCVINPLRPAVSLHNLDWITGCNQDSDSIWINSRVNSEYQGKWHLFCSGCRSGRCSWWDRGDSYGRKWRELLGRTAKCLSCHEESGGAFQRPEICWQEWKRLVLPLSYYLFFTGRFVCFGWIIKRVKSRKTFRLQ